MEIERLNENGQLKQKKIYGKYYRSVDEALQQHRIPNDNTLSFHKEVSFLWSKEGIRYKFEDEASAQTALSSGQYFSSPILAKKASKSEKTNILKSKMKAIEEKIEENDEIIEKSEYSNKLKVEN